MKHDEIKNCLLSGEKKTLLVLNGKRAFKIDTKLFHTIMRKIKKQNYHYSLGICYLDIVKVRNTINTCISDRKNSQLFFQSLYVLFAALQKRPINCTHDIIYNWLWTKQADIQEIYETLDDVKIGDYEIKEIRYTLKRFSHR